MEVKHPEVLMDGGKAKGHCLQRLSKACNCLSQFEGDFGIRSTRRAASVAFFCQTHLSLKPNQ